MSGVSWRHIILFDYRCLSWVIVLLHNLTKLYCGSIVWGWDFYVSFLFSEKRFLSLVKFYSGFRMVLFLLSSFAKMGTGVEYYIFIASKIFNFFFLILLIFEVYLDLIISCFELWSCLLTQFFFAVSFLGLWLFNHNSCFHKEWNLFASFGLYV